MTSECHQAGLICSDTGKDWRCAAVIAAITGRIMSMMGNGFASAIYRVITSNRLSTIFVVAILKGGNFARNEYFYPHFGTPKARLFGDFRLGGT